MVWKVEREKNKDYHLREVLVFIYGFSYLTDAIWVGELMVGWKMDFAFAEMKQQFLDKVEVTLSQALEVTGGALPQSADILLAASRHLCVTGKAKRARPLLTSFFGEALGVQNQQLILAAAAGELIHSASLLHDDVIDDAKIRRGRPTVSHQFGNSVAVLAGNYLLSVSFSLLKEGPKELIYDSIEVIAYMAKAAMAEVSIRGRMDVTPAGWREIALGKTGVLFAWCGQAAARIAGDEDAALRFYKCGLHIGTAFQLVDDLRDLQDKKELKDKFLDIKNREPSFPILLSLQDAKIKNELANLWAQEAMTSDAILQMGERIVASGAVQKTCAAVKLEIETAIDALGHFQETSGGKQISNWLKQLYQTACDGF